MSTNPPILNPYPHMLEHHDEDQREAVRGFVVETEGKVRRLSGLGMTPDEFRAYCDGFIDSRHGHGWTEQGEAMEEFRTHHHITPKGEWTADADEDPDQREDEQRIDAPATYLPPVATEDTKTTHDFPLSTIGMEDNTGNIGTRQAGVTVDLATKAGNRWPHSAEVYSTKDSGHGHYVDIGLSWNINGELEDYDGIFDLPVEVLAALKSQRLNVAAMEQSLKAASPLDRTVTSAGNALGEVTEDEDGNMNGGPDC